VNPKEGKMSVFDLLMLFYKHAISHQQGAERPEMPRCPGCQVSLAELARQPRVGCGDCYGHFREQLLPVIKKAHGAISHVGKVPKKWLADRQESKQRQDEAMMLAEVGGVEARLAQLEENLSLCVQNEDYENAAMIRDEIKRLKERPA
jgi:protein arginine kinase activator